MTPNNFRYATLTLQPGDKAYSSNVLAVEPLPVWTDDEQCVSCWRMTWRERLSALAFGRVWIAVLSGSTQPPISASVAREYFMEKP